MVEVCYKELSYTVVGAAMEVHKVLDPGFLEAVYRKALEHELKLENVPFAEQVRLPVAYKGKPVGDYIADFVIDEKINLEIKSVSSLNSAHEAQALNYLAATGYKLAILLNFGCTSLQQHKQIVR